MFDAPQSRPLKLTAYPFKLKENEILKKDFQNRAHLKICRKKRIKQNKRLVTRDIQFELVFKNKIYFLLSIAYVCDFHYWLVARRAAQPPLLSNEQAMTDDPGQDMMRTCLCSFCKHWGVFFSPQSLAALPSVKRKTLCDTLPFSPSKCSAVCFLVAVSKRFYISWLCTHRSVKSIFALCDLTTCTQVRAKPFVFPIPIRSWSD